MRIEQIRSFVHVYQMRSFSAAAKRLYIEQPVVTKHISQLENELGCPLFVRTTRKVTPTREGDVLYEKASAALLLIDQGIANVKALNAKTKPGIRIGYGHYYMDSTTTPWLKEFEDEHLEGESISIEESPWDQIMSKVLNGELDGAFIGVTGEDKVPSYLEKILIASIDEMMVVGKGHRLAKCDSVGIDDVLNEDFVYPAQPVTADFSVVMRDAEDLGRTLHVRNTEYQASALRIVERGDAVIDLPEVCPLGSADVMAIPYISSHRILYYFIWNLGNDRDAMQDFIKYLESKSRDHSEPR